MEKLLWRLAQLQGLDPRAFVRLIEELAELDEQEAKERLFALVLEEG
ncbi:MAG: hypothetical protein QXK45_03840 [Thermofilaceae archaeon]